MLCNDKSPMQHRPPPHTHPSCAAGGQTLPADRAGRRSVAMIAVLAAVLARVLWWFDPATVHLPLCTFHRLTGLDCPGWALPGPRRVASRADWGGLRDNALWVAAAGVFVRSRQRALDALGPPALAGRTGQPRVWICVTIAAAAFFIVRNLWILFEPWHPKCEALRCP